jgi:hypothetical protein
MRLPRFGQKETTLIPSENPERLPKSLDNSLSVLYDVYRLLSRSFDIVKVWLKAPGLELAAKSQDNPSASVKTWAIRR